MSTVRVGRLKYGNIIPPPPSVLRQDPSAAKLDANVSDPSTAIAYYLASLSQDEWTRTHLEASRSRAHWLSVALHLDRRRTYIMMQFNSDSRRSPEDQLSTAEGLNDGVKRVLTAIEWLFEDYPSLPREDVTEALRLYRRTASEVAAYAEQVGREQGRVVAARNLRVAESAAAESRSSIARESDHGASYACCC